jgi:hypothetical protein
MTQASIPRCSFSPWAGEISPDRVCLAATLICASTVRRVGAPTQDGLAGGGGFIEAAARSENRGGVKTRDIARPRGIGQRGYRCGESIESGFALGFGRLDQQRAVHDERKVHRHWMVPLVDQRLGEIEGGDAGVFQETVLEQDLVHARAGKGQAQIVFQQDAQVVGVEHCVLGDLA